MFLCGSSSVSAEVSKPQNGAMWWGGGAEAGWAAVIHPAPSLRCLEARVGRAPFIKLSSVLWGLGAGGLVYFAFQNAYSVPSHIPKCESLSQGLRLISGRAEPRPEL